MYSVFSVPQSVSINTDFFTFLRTIGDRSYYISKDYMIHCVGNNKDSCNIKIFLDEVSNTDNDLFTTLNLWLDTSDGNILHLNVDEVEQFFKLFDMRSDKDLFLNLAEKDEGEAQSIGEIIFINSLIDIIGRSRQECPENM